MRKVKFINEKYKLPIKGAFESWCEADEELKIMKLKDKIKGKMDNRIIQGKEGES
jgi:hypothetical protein